MNQLISDKGVCRTDPATPGLLNISIEADMSAVVAISIDSSVKANYINFQNALASERWGFENYYNNHILPYG